MKLSTSTGDFSFYVDTIAEKVRCFKGSEFKNINLEQTGTVPEFMEESDDGWKRLAHEWGEAAAYAGVTYVVSHSPCLNPFQSSDDEAYAATIRAIRRSIEICHILSIPRIVVHAGTNSAFTEDEYRSKNKKFYSEFFDLMEKYDITVMTENTPDAPYHTLSTGREMREFIEYVEHPLFAACWDTAHANINTQAKAEGSYQSITALGEKLKGLHISDNFGDGAHHHTWPFAGIVNFDAVVQGLLDVHYDGYFNFEASYTLLHAKNIPYHRRPWVHNGETVTRLLSPSIEMKRKATTLLYEVGKYILESYDCFEE
ncbi:MAG: sugar phosphate isomerase/epimerase [Clostridia bacterium]|nr:sugar phosphate isomerase/epimerase [Clostridia bacterium]